MTPRENPRRLRIRRQHPILRALESALHVGYYVIMATLFAVMLVLGIGSVVNGAQPTYWGTFTQHSCGFGYRGGCQPVGTWVSDSGSMVKRDIQLDGSVDADSTARASYTPTGFNNDAQNNIVHVGTFPGAQSWFPWCGAILIAGLVVFQSRKWRRINAGRRLAGHKTSPS